MHFKKYLVGVAIVVSLVGIGAGLNKPVMAHKVGLIDAEIELGMKDFTFDIKVLRSDGGAAEMKDGVLNLKVGKTVRIKMKNTGGVRHDLHLGKDADKGNELYKNNPFFPYDMFELDVASKGDLTLTIPDKPGDWELGCFQAGHYEAGMKKPFKIVK